MEGFDYRTQKPMSRPVADWCADLSKVITDGGWRRVEHGETFAHEEGGKMLFEVYGNVKASQK